MANYMQVVPVICDNCGKEVTGFYDKGGQWWSKYLRANECEICINCISIREGFAREFKERIGIEVSEMLK